MKYIESQRFDKISAIMADIVVVILIWTNPYKKAAILNRLPH